MNLLKFYRLKTGEQTSSVYLYLRAAASEDRTATRDVSIVSARLAFYDIT